VVVDLGVPLVSGQRVPNTLPWLVLPLL
jgi:hypothetical protein